MSTDGQRKKKRGQKDNYTSHYNLNLSQIRGHELFKLPVILKRALIDAVILIFEGSFSVAVNYDFLTSVLNLPSETNAKCLLLNTEELQQQCLPKVAHPVMLMVRNGTDRDTV